MTGGMGQHYPFDFYPLMKQTLLSGRDSYAFSDKGKRVSLVFLSKGDLTTSRE